eukprot:m.188455 g.188455  ORF g.188455 m.188455 type:complete len:316 (-) comp15081_c1_seq8:6960-7907(-)
MSGQEELGVVGQLWYRVYDLLQSGGNEATEPALRHLDLLDVFSSLAPHWCRGDSWVAAPCTWTADGLADRERVFFVLVTVLLLSSTYISLYFFYEVIVGKWNLFGLRNFKITSRLPPPSAELVRRATVETAINHLIVRPLVLFAAYPWIRMRLRFEPENLPVASTAVLHVVFAMMFDDFWFYWVHRLCHEVGWLYRNIHKQHHEFLHTVVVAVEYANPIEDIFCNTLATVGGPLLLQTHVTIFWFYFWLKLWQSIDAHAGYNLPFPWSPWSTLKGMDCAPAHTYHHAETRGNYGGFFIFWDVVCGTYRIAKPKAA